MENIDFEAEQEFDASYNYDSKSIDFLIPRIKPN